MAVAVAIQPSDLSWSRNQINYHLLVTDNGSPYTPANLPDNYQLNVKVFFEKTYGSGTFTEIAHTESIPDENGLVPIDLQHILHKAYLESLVVDPIPSVNTTSPYIANNLRKYYLEYAEESGNPVVTDAYTTLPTKEIIAGGIDQEVFANNDYLSLIDATNSLLTWYPNHKKIGIDQPEYLTWYNYTGVQKGVVLEIVGYTGSLALSTIYLFDASGGVTTANNQCVVFPVNYLIYSTHSNNILKFTARIVDGSSAYDSGSPVYLSPLRTYYVDYDYYDTVKTLLYLNSFFLPETLRLTGEQKKNLQVSRQISQRILEANYSRVSKEVEQFDFDWDNVWTFRTGNIRKAEVDALQELLIYNSAYEITETGYRPLLLDGRRYEIENTLEFLNSLEFSAVRALKAVNYLNFFLPIALCCCGGAIEFEDTYLIEFLIGIITF